MYCKKCGAVVVGKYCSCCGTRVRSDQEDFMLEYRRREKAFRKNAYQENSLIGEHIASSCWIVANFKAGQPDVISMPYPIAHAKLDEIEQEAGRLLKLFIAQI